MSPVAVRPEAVHEDSRPHARRDESGRRAVTGLRTLLTANLRRDRIWLPAWVGSIVATVVFTVSAYPALYPTATSRERLATSVGANRSLQALYGPAFDLTSAGGFAAWRILGMGAVLVALMCLLTIIRHTRADEEAGRLELVRSCAVGRHAPLLAGVCVGALAAVLVGAGAGAGLVLVGTPAVGAAAMGAALSTVGLVFTGAAAIAAQLTPYARTAGALAGASLGVAYLLRAVADASAGGGWERLWWFSPLGWATHLRPYAGERWLWLVPLGVTALAAILAATVLEHRRDFGGGILASRPGPAGAAPRLAGVLALTWRRGRGQVLGWGISVGLFGMVMGTVAQGVLDLFDDPHLTDLLHELGNADGLLDAYLSAALGIVALLAAAQGVQAVLRLRGDEADGTAAMLLSTSTSRTRLFAGQLCWALGASALTIFVGGLGAGTALAIATGDPHRLGRVLVSALVYVPAAWVIVAVAVALFGALPERAALAWGFLGLCALVGQLGPVLQLPRWVSRVSPVSSVPTTPWVELDATPLAVLFLLSVALTTAGVLCFRLRDID